VTTASKVEAIQEGEVAATATVGGAASAVGAISSGAATSSSVMGRGRVPIVCLQIHDGNKGVGSRDWCWLNSLGCLGGYGNLRGLSFGGPLTDKVSFWPTALACRAWAKNVLLSLIVAQQNRPKVRS
jgi:hypothetical protein